MRKLAFLTIAAVIIIKHRRRPVPHVSVFDLIGNEQARLLYLLTKPEPKGMAVLRRCLTVARLMHLAGNHPHIEA